jgi:hypothetical protein
MFIILIFPKLFGGGGYFVWWTILWVFLGSRAGGTHTAKIISASDGL